VAAVEFTESVLQCVALAITHLHFIASILCYCWNGFTITDIIKHITKAKINSKRSSFFVFGLGG